MRTLFVDNLPSVGGEVALERREAEHLFRVLRAAPGERVRLLDGRGGRAVAEVLPDRVLRVALREEVPVPEPRLHLFFAQPRRNRLDALLPACAELGVWELHPVHCARSVAEGEPNDRWRLQLIEGCKQSGNPYLPRVAAPEPLLTAVGSAASSGVTLFFGSVAAAAPAAPGAGGDIGWIVGPEGGFTADEESALRELGARPLNLGPWVLRLETAAVCGLAVLRHLTWVLLLTGVLLAGGCSDRDAAKHPLTRKGDYYRAGGDAVLAAKFYRRAAEKFPDDAGLRLKLATLYDESLNDPLAAAWHYSEYLRLAPDSAESGTVAAYRQAALERLAAPELAAEARALREENRKLGAALAATRRRLFRLEHRAAETPPVPVEKYTVRSGDTPVLIARRKGISLESLLLANRLTVSSRLRVGQELVIPPPRRR